MSNRLSDAAGIALIVLVLGVAGAILVAGLFRDQDQKRAAAAHVADIAESQRSLRRTALEKCIGDGGYPIDARDDVVCLRRESVLWTKDVGRE